MSAGAPEPSALPRHLLENGRVLSTDHTAQHPSCGLGDVRTIALGRQSAIGAVAVIAGLVLGFLGFMALAQTPAEPGSEAAELIGGVVFSAEGTEVGEVSAVTVGQDGEIAEIRVTTALRLGLGQRTVVIRRGKFMALRGAVVLTLSADEVDALPSPAALRGTAA
jgi:hypothetical protein